jgi:hypothetical protein
VHDAPVLDRAGAEANDALERLIEHGAGSAERTGSGFADVVWQFEHGSGALALGDVWSSIASALQRLRFTALGPADQLHVAYAIAEVISSGSRRPLAGVADDVRMEFESFVWRVACAWEAFLAGDIDNLVEHVQLEAMGAELPAWP